MLTYLLFMYRWKIPPEEQENFRRDWAELTKLVQERYGSTEVALYVSETGEFVGIAKWPNVQTWERWVEEMADHPMRKKYRQWRIVGPELLSPVVVLGAK